MTISKYQFDPLVRSASAILVLKHHRRVGATERVAAIKASAALLGKSILVEESSLNLVFIADSPVRLDGFDAIVVMLSPGAQIPQSVFDLSNMTALPVGVYDYVSCPAFTDEYEQYLDAVASGGALAQLAETVGIDDVFAAGSDGPRSLSAPSIFYRRDESTRQWLPDLPAAAAARKSEVTAELARRLYLPCNGFDADKLARERISGMIARLQRGDGLPAGWMGWRDANNDMHWAADDAATVLANLTALSRSIEDREQALLVASWTHKANIAALTDIHAILAYDVTAAW